MKQRAFCPERGIQVEILEKLLATAVSPVSCLLAGQRGLYMEEAAEKFAASILGCTEDTLLSNSDFLLLEKPEGKNSIGVDELSPLLDFSALLPVGRYRVCVIPDMDCLTVQAQNKLLKTLEESRTTVIVGVSNSGGERLLPTIKSRMRVFRFLPYGDREAYGKAMSLTDEALIADSFVLTGGCPGTADVLEPLMPTLRKAKTAFVEGDAREFLKNLGELREKDTNEIYSVSKEGALCFLDLLEAAGKEACLSLRQRLALSERIGQERQYMLRPAYSKAMYFTFLSEIMAIRKEES